MPSYLCIAVRFLQRLSHGRGDGGAPEWPPSPLRLFQSLAAASAARWNERTRLQHALPALRWLEQRQAPMLVAAPGESSHVRYRLYVPDNVGDKVARSWCRGGSASIADFRFEKDVCPTNLQGDVVYYLYPLTEGDPGFARHYEVVVAAARSITHLGWGIDMATADATVITEEDTARLSGERWQPVPDASMSGYRVPMPGTLDALIEKHKAFLGRVRRDANGNEWFNPVPALSVFRVVGYRRAGDQGQRHFAAFSILKLDASGFRAFDAVRKALTVAGMTRCATERAAKASGWPGDKINAFVLGHGRSCLEPGESSYASEHVPVGPKRFAYFPLPSIERRGEGEARVVGNVRRVMVSCFTEECAEEVVWARRMLSGQELVDEDTKGPVALLSLIPDTEKIVRCYTQAATTWATVTPVVLPGYDDPDHLRRRAKGGKLSPEQQRRILGHLCDRIDDLLRKAIIQAGFSQELANNAALEWRKVGFWPGADLADRYGVPDHLKRFPRLHVKLRWRDAGNRPVEISGPVCLGGGRFYGVGLFARF